MDFDDLGEEDESYCFEFELLNSEDGLTTTLVCRSDQPMSPDDFAQALRSFANRIDSIANMSDVSGGIIN